MSVAKQFRREVDRLYFRRASWLRNVVDFARPGRPPRFTRRQRDRAITTLQELASDALAGEFARDEFGASIAFRRSWHVKRGKGWRYEARKRAFLDWYESRVGLKICIYVFWSKRGCEYVGRTTNGASRPASHFEKHWFRRVSRIDAYAATGRRAISALECLARHRFQPIQNRIAPSRHKWTRACPMCKLHADIDSELRALFPLR